MDVLPTEPFLGMRLAALTEAELAHEVLERARRRERTFTIGYLNAAQVNLAYDDPEHARRMAGMDCLYADGQGVVWGARWLGARLPGRVNAGDFIEHLCRKAARRGLRVALIGGRPQARREGEGSEAAAAAHAFARSAPGLEIVLTWDGYFGDRQAEVVREAIEQADPDLVLVGMGAPRQERWALEWAAAGRPRVWWCVGALFEYYSGTRLRAPVWMRRAGLEWFVRLALEPRRLWRRYVIGNPVFVWRVLRGRPPKGLAD